MQNIAQMRMVGQTFELDIVADFFGDHDIFRMVLKEIQQIPIRPRPMVLLFADCTLERLFQDEKRKCGSTEALEQYRHSVERHC